MSVRLSWMQNIEPPEINHRMHGGVILVGKSRAEKKNTTRAAVERCIWRASQCQCLFNSIQSAQI